MAIFKPFRALRPRVEFVSEVACRPYDVINTNEARGEAGGKENSFLHVTKPEIDFPDGQDPHDVKIYRKAADAFKKLLSKKIFFQDKQESFYLYMLVMDGREQNGFVGCLSVDDYISGVIKVHELTRPDKEEDRRKHIEYSQLQAEPVFMACHSDPQLKQITIELKKNKPEYDFISEDGIRHVLWKTDDKKVIKIITESFAKLDSIYIADGHHRTAAAATIGVGMKAKYPQGSSHQYIMSVIFPDDELKILDYNRLVKDLNGLSRDEFLELLGQSFDIHSNGPMQHKPSRLHEFSMYFEGNWFILNLKPSALHVKNQADDLDVQILTSHILTPILGINDIRTDKRIDFVGGLRGLNELEKRVNSGEMAVAYALYPVSLQQLMNIADSGEIMPPKSTWFEPKLRSGLFVHQLS
jgi:uncharacterized protein (DUF1015 family)